MNNNPIQNNFSIQINAELWYNGSDEDRNKIIEKYGHISNWNVSGVTNMSKLFKDKKNFNENINNWDVSQVTDMSEMFSGAEIYNQPMNKWDVSKVTYMSGMFQDASHFDQNLSMWDVKNVGR